MRLSKFKIPFIIFGIGILCYIVGTLFKIQHWPWSSELYTTATILEIIAGGLALYIVLKKDES